MAQAEHHAITRRQAIAASAAFPLAAVPVSALAAELSDPIFTAITAHRQAYADLVALMAA
jgi:hypothetical protein